MNSEESLTRELRDQMIKRRIYQVLLSRNRNISCFTAITTKAANQADNGVGFDIRGEMKDNITVKITMLYY